jgi:hypothetical protein
LGLLDGIFELGEKYLSGKPFMAALLYRSFCLVDRFEFLWMH